MRVAPVAAVGVDRVGCDDFAGVEVDDCDGGFVDDGSHAFASVICADPDVVYPGGQARPILLLLASAVVAESELTGRCAVDGSGTG